jgi:ABC-type polysaccharide/polyol phosphate transport system ATPase subunit
MPPPVIEVDHVTKEFRLGQLTSLTTSLRNAVNRMLGRPVAERAAFKALDDVSFTVQQGEVLGIIGHNGAGKSTLLKLLAGISQPTHGRVSVRGRVAPLIEVGAGLVAEMTGRENVFLNASILGMRRDEVKRKFDEIVAFAELEEFIDTPVKRYSSGMQVRLGFAIATAVESEVLIVDEVLAVGDLAFQRKCFDRLERLIHRDQRTVLLVSHNIRQVERICRRVVLLDHGHMLADGLPSSVCDEFYARSNRAIAEHASRGSPTRQARFESSGDLELVGINLLNEQDSPLVEVCSGDSVRVAVHLRCDRALRGLTFGLGVHTTDFIYLATHSSEAAGRRFNLPRGESTVYCDLAGLPLLPGVYQLRLGVTDSAGATLLYGENLQQLRIASRGMPAAMREGVFALNARWTDRQGVAC